MKYKIPIDTIKEALELKGEFVIWADRPPSHFSSESSHKRYNTLFKGTEFGYDCEKYRYGSLVVNGRNMRLLYHVAKWVLLNDSYPKGVIDHKDGDGLNNSSDNLRDVSRIVNARNAKMRSDNTSGVNGVHWNNKRYVWCVQGYQTVDGKIKNTYLGEFTEIEDAKQVRLKWERKIGCSDRHGK